MTYEYRCSVLSVHDGDTLRLDVDLGFTIHQTSLDCRYAGFDAPELKRADGLGEHVQAWVRDWMLRHPGPYLVITRKDQTEKYGRYLIAKLTAPDGSELLTDQLAAGFLKLYSGSGPKPTWP